MKKLILFTVLLSCVQVESEAFASNAVKTSISESKSDAAFKTKRRRKKGFLWGLFKKKDCGCPKH
ncbi:MULTISPECIES: hypothetical protein [Arcicella]|uniref:Uncharacterized protein n=1 Tax=Arcicella aquatica TaxID=217141 RepID=A0ABU5QMH8_9BACT|nr:MULTISPECIES: hypothetical protein [Arcicella]MDR6561147.1 hypothetical protein [Arcicella sp. BE51]MDR6811031.1 hypothetical protein [Arcicella sp. BE140]MDR6822381.1 hypothetical protein [Arcicella sp. BE139]MEA5258010.1 hypothetical protein [Arcicella aquatica]